jgi:hypothetical protein
MKFQRVGELTLQFAINNKDTVKYLLILLT